MINSHGIPSFIPMGNLSNLREELAQIHDNSLSDAEMLISMIRAVNKMGLIVGEMADNWNVIENWIKTNGVDSSVRAIMQRWETDGTLAKILDETALKEINNNLDNLRTAFSNEVAKMKDYTNSSVISLQNENKNTWDKLEEQIKTGLAGGAIKGVYATLTELKEKYKNGSDGVYLVIADKNLYYWNLNTKSWDNAGAYLEPQIDNYSIEWYKIKYPFIKGTIIQGNITIDTKTNKILISKDFALDLNFQFAYPNHVAELTIPDGTGTKPAYLYLNLDEQEYHIDLKKSSMQSYTSSDVLIGVLYQEKFMTFSSHDNKFITYPNENYRTDFYQAQVAQGNIQIDMNALTVSTTDSQTVFVKSGQLKDTHKTISTVMPASPDDQIIFIFFDYVNEELICTKSFGDINRNQWYIGGAYRGEMFDTDSTHFNFINKAYPNNAKNYYEPILFDESYIINVKESVSGDSWATQSFTGNVKFRAGECFYINKNGHYIQIPDETNLDYSYTQTDVAKKGNLLSVYFDKNDKKAYASFYPNNYSDYRLFSIYRGKIYGSRVESFVVNGIKKGGWGDTIEPSNSSSKHVIDWFENATTGSASNIAWLGDSTWAGLKVVDPKNIFPEYINNLLPTKFKGVKSYNCSVSGYSTTQLYNNFDNLIKDTENLGLVFIGGGLNDGITSNQISNNMISLDKLVKKVIELNCVPVIVTTQATAMLYSRLDESGDWNKEQHSADEINIMRRNYAKKNNIDILDLEKYTKGFIDNSSASMSSMFDDYLHGKDNIHVYEANVAMSFINQNCIMVNNDINIGITTQSARSNVNYKQAYTNYDTPIENFKVGFKYNPKPTDNILSVELFIPENNKNYSLKSVINSGTLNINVDGKKYTSDGIKEVVKLSSGYHWLSVTSDDTNTIDFAGLQIVGA